LKTVCPQGRVGSNPTLSADICRFAVSFIKQNTYYIIVGQFGEVPKLAEGAPLERE
jgi:hypothetical protein